MLQHWNRSGISFQYPANWEPEEETREDGWTLTLYSSGTTFLTVHFDTSMPTLEQVVDTTLSLLQEEHKDLECKERIGSFARQMSFGLDIHFFSFDLPCSCWVRSVFGIDGTFLILWQSSDEDLEENGPTLEAIIQSMEVIGEHEAPTDLD